MVTEGDVIVALGCGPGPEVDAPAAHDRVDLRPSRPFATIDPLQAPCSILVRGLPEGILSGLCKILEQKHIVLRVLSLPLRVTQPPSD